MKDKDTVSLGGVAGPHGVKGELRIFPYGALEGWLAGKIVFLGQRAYTVKDIRPFKKLYLMTLEGVTTIDQVEALRGMEIELEREELPPPGHGEYYIFELKDMEVVDEREDTLGTVKDVLETGANHVIEVQGSHAEFLFPLIEDVVVEISRERKRIVVRLPEGLLPREGEKA
ncbi:MAG: 16S rRNA processing protein RimM [Deltaproteobacteria bacterium]|nr:16S rRNA processing protein RimM [Deltaproteobacteria bacterium]